MSYVYADVPASLNTGAVSPSANNYSASSFVNSDTGSLHVLTTDYKERINFMPVRLIFKQLSC